MKSLFVCFGFIFSSIAFSQVGVNTTAPDASSMLDITSTNKGFLMPRMTSVQRIAIATPAEGLTVYDTTTKSFWYWNGAIWIQNTSNNIYNTDGTLTANRVVTQGANTLSFIGTSVNAFNVDGSTFSVDASNNRIGIGTASPLSTLHIYEPTGNAGDSNSGTIYLQHGNSGGTSSIVFRNQTNGGSDSGWIKYSDNGSGDATTWERSLLEIGVGNDSSGFLADNIALMPSANVGIGTITPSEKLDVVGNIKFSGALMPNNNAGTAGQVLTSGGAGSNPTWVSTNTLAANNIYNSNGTLTANRVVTQGANTLSFTGTGFTIFNSGNVGFGTTNPSTIIDARGTISALVPTTSNRADVIAGATNFWSGSSFTGAAISYRDATDPTIYATIPMANSAVMHGQNVSKVFMGTNQDVPVYFTSGASIAMTIGANKNLGIGTTTPNAPLQFSNTVVNRKIVLYDSSNNDNQFYGFGINSGTLRYQTSSSAADHAFFSGIDASSSSELLRIKGNGNVGIGTNNPQYRLDLANGTFGFGLNNVRTETRNNAGLQGNAGAQSGFFETNTPSNFPTGATSWWHLIDSRHNNETNNYALQIAGSFFDQDLWFRKTNNNPATPWSRILTSNSGWSTLGNTGTNPTNNFIGTTDNQSFVIRTNDIERIRVTNTGNVGVGTNNPAQRLDVQGGNARINNVFVGDVGHGAGWAGMSHIDQDSTTGYGFLQSSNGANTFINKANTGSGYIGFRVGNADQVVIANNGNMGIGNTNPVAKLNVSGVSQFDIGLGNGRIILGTPSSETGIVLNSKNSAAASNEYRANIIKTNDDLIFTNSGLTYSNTTRMLIDQNGNVGIGLTDPTSRLHVSGNLALSTGGNSTANSIVFMSSGTFNLPAANTCPGRIYIIRNTSDVNDVTINSVIDIGYTAPPEPLILYAYWGTVTVASNGTYWYVIGY